MGRAIRGRAAVGLLLAVLLAACGREPQPERSAESVDDAGVATGAVQSFDGVPIAYTVRGEGAGALLFIHGWGGSADWWAGQPEAFTSDYRVVTIDLAGHGASGADRRTWSIESLARDVEAVIDGLDLGPVVLIGHSLGGVVALETARRRPQSVVGVIGVDAFRPADPAEDAKLAAWIDRLREDFDRECRLYVETALLDDEAPSTVTRVTTGMCDADPRVAVDLLSAQASYDLLATIGTVPVPVRALESDRRPTVAAELRAHHRDFDVRVIEASGRFPMIERPDETNRVLAQLVEEITSGDTL